MSAPGEQRRVLVFAYYFPPLGGAGVQRILKFIKYLPQSGWGSTVVTTGSAWYPTRDPTLLAEVPEATPIARPADPGVLRLATRVSGLLGAAPAQAVGWPDQGAAWIPGAVRAGLRAVRRHRPDVLLSTAAPLSTHLAALAVARRTGLPWVADFRDEWASNPYVSRVAPIDALTRRAEAAVRERASFVTVASEHYEIGGRGPDDPKRVTITNGVDPDDVPALAPTPSNARMRLVFAGTLYGDIDCRPVFEALARLAARGAVDPARIEFRLAGNLFLPDVASSGAVPTVRLGYLPHADAVAEMAAADLLVVHVDPKSRHTPAKVFEYLATGRPILCVTRPDGLSHRLVDELGGGWAVAPDDDAAVERAIEQAYRRWSAGDLETRASVREAVLRRYGRDVLTRQLAGVLDAAAAQRPASSR